MKSLLLLGAAIAALGLLGLVRRTVATGARTQPRHSRPASHARHSRNARKVFLATRDAIDVDCIPADAFMDATNSLPTSRGTHQFIFTCSSGIKTSDARKLLEDSGMNVVGFIPARAFRAEATIEQASRVSGSRGFGNALHVGPIDKVAPNLASRLRGAGHSDTFECIVMPLRDEDLPGLAATVESLGGSVVAAGGKTGNRILATGGSALFHELARRDDVRWIEERMKRVLLNDKAVEAGGMDVHRVWNSLGLTGAGQTVAICDSGIDTGDTNSIHGDFAGRIVGYSIIDGKSDGRDTNGHGTHTAGSLAGNGAMSGGLYRGVAFDAAIFAQMWGGDFTWGMEEVFDDGQDTAPHMIHSNSWGYDKYADGTSCAGAYISACSTIDAYAWSHPEFLPVFSAGNSGNDTYDESLGGASTLTPPATAKNVLSVGATMNTHADAPDMKMWKTVFSRMASFSSQGPCLDGRIKPDVVAPGMSVISCRSSVEGAKYDWGTVDANYAYSAGTSMACPLAAGSAALVRQFLSERAGFSGTPPSAALVKAVLCGGATDLSLEGETNLSGRPVPDTIQGFGRVSLASSLAPTNGVSALFKDRIPFEEFSSWSFQVMVTNSAAPLDVQLCWIDYPALENAGHAIVNDLDLVAVSPSGRVIYGNCGAFADELDDGETPYDDLNNNEGIRVSGPETGTWTIAVNGEVVPWGSGEGGAAALYARGAFDPNSATEPELAMSYRLVRTCFLGDFQHPISPPATNILESGAIPVEVPDSGFGGLDLNLDGTPLKLAFILHTPMASGASSIMLDASGRMPRSFTLALSEDTYLDYIYLMAGDSVPGSDVPMWWFDRFLYGTASRQEGDQTYSGILASDYDGDGFDNGQEYMADTDPVDAGSRLSFIGIDHGALRWIGGRESTQFVMRAGSPSGPWTKIATNAPPTHVTNEFHIDIGAAPSGFFRIEAAR